ncbi:MAG: glucose-6-phosphate isomerase [Clostridia bacterium]|nr:glucose-6-phosphate isomerase [Clostridia bacterium]
MAIKLNEKYLKGFVTEAELDEVKADTAKAIKSIAARDGEGNDYLGWIDLPVNYDKDEFAAIKKAAEKIKNSCDIFVVIGIGGSYLGARAAIEFIKSPLYNNMKKDTPDIYFAGNGLSGTALEELLAICEGKDICVNVISKSGTTTEPAIAFRVFRDLLEKKYGEQGAKERIFATTDKAKGSLKTLATEKGYQTFVVPDDVGGRYSVLTAVGLLPIAVAGCDIDALMKGAADAREAYNGKVGTDCERYAIIRNCLHRKGKDIEILACYQSFFTMTAEWWKQLYGESEGKDGKGIYPASVIFSTDLHSMGQMIQEGKRNIFETVVDIKNTGASVTVPSDEANLDGLGFIAGQSLDSVNFKAFQATALAHCDGGVPNIVLELDEKSEYDFGYMVYFFEMACAISGYTLGVNPFNQPGVESYKKNMYALLGKPGAENEARRAELLARLEG